MALVNPAPDYFEPADGMFLHESNPLIMKFFNSYIIIKVEGGPTDDKAAVQAKAPGDSNTLSCAMNVRVRDIRKLYEEWTTRGADFLSEPKDHGTEIRCYLRDPDGYLVEVGQGL